ncbi:peptide-binding protein, partial [Streptomyces sp. JV178]
QIDKYGKSEDKNIDLVESSGLEIRYLAFNTDASPVKSTAVRRAVAQIIDRGALVSKVYGSQSEPLFSIVPA